ncbi:helicase-associated domain-containing protein [Pseudonocardia sp. DSM 110487]|uniref:helicase-associated domain-containing protein n=1 Tax=Pseudonocardia sp. DSM 110487 TaxID=2865833 RepID=UPI001C698F1F|nr:helicase-associated domain-containing protein [Pseudonocardia sp. DSM 110487]QYN37803.1 helicase-associated domain-containing protein [Pseudonocardia sp. DSM 110487]
MSLATYLATLDVDRLEALLRRRPDVLIDPAPRTVDELAMRLNGIESLTRALELLNRDEMIVARAVALIGEPTPATLAGRLGVPEDQVQHLIDGLCAYGLAWHVDGRVGLPARWAEQLAESVARFRPLAVIARQANVEHLRAAVAGLGGEPDGLRKPDLGVRLEELIDDPAVIARAVAGLSGRGRRYLDQVCRGSFVYLGFRSENRGSIADLTRAGLLVDGPSRVPELPRETAVMLLLLGEDGGLTGAPQLPAATSELDDGRAGAEGALRAVTTLLDEARIRPLAALKKGGVGTRERARIARLGLAEPALWIDIAAAAGLLALTPEGYPATSAFDEWRDEDPGVRWARIALAWFGLALAPTSREIDDGEVPPPLPLESFGGLIRRALFRAAAGGRSIRAVGEQIDWLCPLHHYDAAGRARKVAAAVQEATQLGLVAGDRLTALGEQLAADADGPDAEEELARRATELLPATAGSLVLQSDLTAVASGQLSAAASKLLAGTAVAESRGTAAIWRFTPDSVRGALDDGWSADELRAALAAASDRPLPQPLDYLIGDVARRHGSVRVRVVRSCVTGEEPEISEILHTRSLRRLQLTRLAPTVLASPLEAGDLLPKLRAAGFAPMPEDAEGVVTVPQKENRSAPSPRTARARARVDPCDLAARLLAARTVTAPASKTEAELASLAPGLDVAEVALLADALERGRDVKIVYRNKEGNRTARDIRPEQLYGRWLNAWCHLRSAEREFTVAGIESVGPVG